MSGISEIETQIRSIENRIDTHMARLQSVKDEISETMDKTYANFGKTEEGQELIRMLSCVLIKLSKSDSLLYVLKADLNSSVGRLKG